MPLQRGGEERGGVCVKGRGPVLWAESGCGKVPAGGHPPWGRREQHAKPQSAKSSAPHPSALLWALLWAFTRRLPTMRRCLRKFLGVEARGCWWGPPGGVGVLPPAPLPDFVPFCEGCPPGAPSSLTGQSHRVPLLPEPPGLLAAGTQVRSSRFLPPPPSSQDSPLGGPVHLSAYPCCPPFPPLRAPRHTPTTPSPLPKKSRVPASCARPPRQQGQAPPRGGLEASRCPHP